MNSWRKDKFWSDRFITEVRRILALHLECTTESVVVASSHDDEQCATDLIVFLANTLRVACRLRRSQYVLAFADEFTIRTNRSTGTKTELEKMPEPFHEAKKP